VLQTQFQAHHFIMLVAVEVVHLPLVAGQVVMAAAELGLQALRVLRVL